MPRNGSGTATPPATMATANTVSNAATVNSIIDDAYTCLTDSINKDGTKAFAANQSMGGFKLTSVGNGTAAGDAVNAGQLQAGRINWADAGGTADAITGTYTPAPTSLTDGDLFFVRASAANATTTPTFTPNSGVLTARTIVKGANTALAVGDINGDGHEMILRYRASDTKYILLNPYSSAASDTLSGVVELATDAETWTGTDTTRATTPSNVAAVRFTTISPSQITSNQNDYNPTGFSTAAIVRVNSDAVNRQITGFATGAANREFTVVNVGTFDITLRSEGSGSSAANRITFDSNGTSFILAPTESVTLFYDTTSSRWRPRCHTGRTRRVLLPSSVVNNNAVANTIADVTGLSFGVISGLTYKFRFFIEYTAAADTTGSRWSVNGPAKSNMQTVSRYGLTATSETVNYTGAAYDAPASANASTPPTIGTAIIDGTITPSADGTVIARFASEVSGSAITAIALYSYVEYEIIA